MALHVALVGDSVLDNGIYLAGDPDVAAHLQRRLGESAQVSVLAREGTTTLDVDDQIADLDSSVTHVVVSLGGADAVLNVDLLSMRASSTAEAFELCRSRLDVFDQAYTAALRRLAAVTRARLIVCTVYVANLPSTEVNAVGMALRLFNDIIIGRAVAAGADVIDLRSVCCEPAHFSQAIGPSALGGERIAQAIATVVDWGPSPMPRMYVREVSTTRDQEVS